MSLTKAVTIWCDATWCYKWENYNEAKAKDTRKSAGADGWVSTKHGDFCCLEHSKGKRTKAEKARTKYEKQQAKRDAAAGNSAYGDRVLGDDSSPDTSGSPRNGKSSISSLMTRVSPDSPVNH